ncbi:hypothetical protein MD484_g7668, partial [Candolleomyces efflorescens]
MKDITYHDAFVPRNGPRSSSREAITLGAGVQWGEAYSAAHARNRLIVGGVSKGGSVGAAGGWILGGGHSALTPSFGFGERSFIHHGLGLIFSRGVDNVLEFKIVTADARHLTVNDYTNRSLFWALRGGGGGSFGIVTSVTYRVHPDVPIIGSFAIANFSSPEIAQTAVTEFVAIQPKLTDNRWGGYASLYNRGLQMFYIAPNVSMSSAQDIINPFFDSLTNITQGAVQTFILPFNSFSDWMDFIFNASLTSQVGSNEEISSRLLPRDGALTRPAEIAKALLSFPRGVGFNCVAGGVSSRVYPDSVAFNPSWRKALVEVAISESWGENASGDEIRAAQQRLIANTQILDTITTDSASYYNEASQ